MKTDADHIFKYCLSFIINQLGINFTYIKSTVMKTLLEDTDLEYEIQELYILSKHWMSDINFIEDEIRILKDILNKYLIDMGNLQIKEARNFDRILVKQDAIILDFKVRILELLKFIEPFVNGAKEDIGINLIEKFTKLEAQINSLSAYVKLLKKLLFSFTEDVIIAKRAMFI
jgi:hypothetical protein